MSEERHTLIKTASYEAEPGEVGRVLLLYSGGLDTSVMLKWIQDEYEAEVVALTVNLGQPGEDYEVIKGKALHPEMKIIAPVRGWQMGREEEIAYAREHGIPVKGGTETPPYSIDDNLWGRSSEGGAIEDLDEPPRDDVFQLVTRPEEAPDEPEEVTVGFERGVPVSLDGERLGLVELLERAGELGARHGAGIVDHIEDRIVGLKVRDLYEVPAAAVILTAHKELEKLVGTIHQNTFKPHLDDHWAYLVYAGLWYEPLLSDLNAFMDAVNEQVTGEVTMRLYKGSARAVARRSPNALYDPALAGFGESRGLFSPQASPGFIELWSLQSRMAYNVRNRRD